MVYCVAASALMPRSQLCAPICGSVSGLYRDPGAVRSLLREGSDMRFAFIAKRRAVWPVAWLCEALDVSRPGFHAWLNRSPSARSRRDEVLVTAIDGSFKSSDRTYGARRVWHDMLAEGRSCGLHRIERLMRQNRLRARPRRRGLPIDTGERAAVSDLKAFNVMLDIAVNMVYVCILASFA
jgi:hypothetical protein